MMEIAQRLLLFTMASAIPCLIAFKYSSDYERWIISRSLAIIVSLVTLTYNAYFLFPSNFIASVSLPLQVCDLLGLLAILALAIDWQPARAVLALCAIPFVSQAVLTPVGEQDFTSARTLLYWAFHWCIFSTFLFEVIIRKLRLLLHDLFKMFIVDIIYVACITSLNVTFNWNYGYIGNNRPSTTTLVDFLGPWPYRILSMTVLGFVLQSICFVIFRQRNTRHDLP